jgi:hypothetical protein
VFNGFVQTYKNVELNHKELNVSLGEKTMNLITGKSHHGHSRTKYLKPFYLVRSNLSIKRPRMRQMHGDLLSHHPRTKKHVAGHVLKPMVSVGERYEKMRVLPSKI